MSPTMPAPRPFLTSPNLASLRFFAAAARHLSFKRAAADLHVTQGAVSQQIKHLEDALGCSLFERLPRGIALTAAGRRLAEVVSRALTDIESVAHELQASRDRVTIRLRVGPSFALRWLVPRIGAFYRKHPDIGLFIVGEYGALDGDHGAFDLAVEMTDSAIASMCTEELMDEWLVPVCSSRYLQEHEIRTPADLQRCTLLHDAHAFIGGEPDAEWKLWLQAAGADAVDASQGQFFTLANMSLEAALADQGVALGRRAHIQDLLRAEKLVAPFSIDVKSRMRYCLVYHKARARQRGMEEVMGWLRAQATADDGTPRD